MKPDRFCAVTDCPRDVYADGLCRHHRAAGDPDRHPPRCIKAGCDRVIYARDLCRPHWAEMRADIHRQRELERQAPQPVTLPTSEPDADVHLDDVEPLQPLVVYCPNDLLGLVAACADLDAKAIVRAIWPHFLEAILAGLEPFTLDETS